MAWGPLRIRLKSLHTGTAVLFGIVLFVILFTGTWSAAQQVMASWWQPLASRDAAQPLSLDALLDMAKSHGLPFDGLRIVLPASDDEPVQFCLGQRCPISLDPITGSAVPGDLPGEILVRLHNSFHAGFPGRVVLSLFGVVLMVLLVSGIVTHGRRLKHVLRLRRNAGLSIHLFDLHSLIGLWAMPWILLFAFTGAMSGLGALGTLALGTIVYPGQPRAAMMQLMPPPAPRAAGRPWQKPPKLDAILAEDRRAYPAFLPVSVSLNRWGDANASVEIAGVVRGVPSTPLFERHLYRAEDGQLWRLSGSRGKGFWVRAFLAIQPLHFAQYAWLPGAGIWLALHLLMGLAATVLAASGLLMWVRRHGSAQPRAVRVMSVLACSVCGGLVLASALLLPAAQVWAAVQPAPQASPALAPFFWTSWVAAAFGVAAMGRFHVRQPARCLLVLAAASCAVAAMAHVLRIALMGNIHGWQAWHVDLVLLGLGSLLVHYCRYAGRAGSTPAASPVLTRTGYSGRLIQ